MMRALMKPCVWVAAALFSGPLLANDIVTVRWDHGGKNVVVAAFDLSRPGLLWEAKPCRSPNFAQRTSVGVLVGCDDSNVALLDPATGRVLWQRDLAVQEPDEWRREQKPYREIAINRFHHEGPNGFFLSRHDDEYVLVGKQGEYRLRCDKQSCTASPRADREEARKAAAGSAAPGAAP